MTGSACRRCGTEPRAGARFCDACGSPIVVVDTPAEHKQVTVLFADVVRSMDLAAVLDSERLREVMGDVFNRCGAVIQRYGGMVNQFTGDGIMALFGAPIARWRTTLSAPVLQRLRYRERHRGSPTMCSAETAWCLRSGSG